MFSFLAYYTLNTQERYVDMMATLSGRIVFDRDRSATISGGDTGLANVPIVLQNIKSSARLVILSDSNGNYAFNNVPPGDYRLVESYKTAGGILTPGDFGMADIGPIPEGGNPPISYATNPPVEATNLDSLTPDTVLLTLDGNDVSDMNFLDGPVTYTPIESILDDYVVISDDNLIDEAGGGDFGIFPPGTLANTGVATDPFPGMSPDFVYVLPNPATFTPDDGQYTIQNIMNNARSTGIGTWWRVASRNKGNEEGLMMVVNGHMPGSVIFKTTVAVDRSTYYLFDSWILNLFKINGYADPKLRIRIRTLDLDVIYDATLGNEIPVSYNAPEWKQIGSVVNSRNNDYLVIEFISEGDAAIGNDYVLSGISLCEIDVPLFTPVKSCNVSQATVGEVVEYSITLENTSNNPLVDIVIHDVMPDGLTIVPDSLTVNDVPFPEILLASGLGLPDLEPKGILVVNFLAFVTHLPHKNPTVNRAWIIYKYTPVSGGVASEYLAPSNDVEVEIVMPEDYADIWVKKTAKSCQTTVGAVLTYDLVVGNDGVNAAEDIMLTDDVTSLMADARFSVDDETSWAEWTGEYVIDFLGVGASVKLVITGDVLSSTQEILTNTATVSCVSADPDLRNNSVTTSTSLWKPRICKNN